MKIKSTMSLIVLSGLFFLLLFNCKKEAIKVIPSATVAVVTDITANSATVGGEVSYDGGASVTARGVCWSTSQNPTIANDKTSDGTGVGVFGRSITGLTPGTTYNIVAYAINSVGVGYSSPSTFTTLALAPVLTTTELTAVTSISVSSGGNITNDGGSAVTARGVCWSTNQNPTITDGKTSNGTGSGSFTSAITGLTPGATYYVRAYATNGIGTAYGNQATTTTTAISPVITTTALSSITSTTAASGGNISSDGGSTVTARGVCWSTSQNPTITGNKTSDGIGAGSFMSAITGLTPGATYYVRAYATNRIGTTYGNQLTATSTATLPVITTTSISSITSTTATSGGNISSDGGALVTLRGVCWSTTQNPTTANDKTSDGNGVGVFSRSITGLTPETTYYGRAFATNSVGTAYGNQISFTTISSANIVLFTYPTVSSITLVSAISGGGISSDGGDAIIAKGVCWSTTNFPTLANNKTIDGIGTGSFNSSLSGLLPKTTYFIRAYATNSKGTSYGSLVSFATPTPVIGNYYQGGIIAYIFQIGDPGYNVGQTHGLISAQTDLSTNIPFYPIGNYTYVLGATSTAIGSGISNTNAIVAALGVGNYAAKLCFDLVLGGFDDWCLPSKDELDKLYLKRNIIGHFNINNYYWSSSVTVKGPWLQEYNDGVQYNSGADSSGSSVRAVRSF